MEAKDKATRFGVGHVHIPCTTITIEIKLKDALDKQGHLYNISCVT